MINQKPSLRKAINAHCKSCVYDPLARGTWLAQVTLCSVTVCELYDVRPRTDSIADSVLGYYGVTDAEIARLGLRKAPEGRFSDESSKLNSQARGTR